MDLMEDMERNLPQDLREPFDGIIKKRTSITKLESNIDRLNNICKHVELKWKGVHIYPYTPHDHTHNIMVEHMLYELFAPKQLNNRLLPEEVFLLLTSIWLHDIGMNPELFTDENTPNQEDLMIKHHRNVRETHEERTKKYIQENQRVLQLTRDEVNALIEICSRHRYKKYKELLEFASRSEKIDVDGIGIQVPLLIACLRLSDALHIPHRGEDTKEFKIYMALGLDVFAKIHWLKSKYAWEISPNKEMFEIRVILRKPPNIYPNKWDKRMEPLRYMLEKELQDEVDAIREFFIKGGITVYLTVKCEYREYAGMASKDVKELEELLTDIVLFEPIMSPNASAVTDVVLRQINSILGFLFTLDAKYKEKFLKKDIRNINQFFKERGYDSISNSEITSNESSSEILLKTQSKKYIINEYGKQLYIYEHINPSESINLLREYKINVLDIIIKERPCHVFLWKVKSLLEKNIPNSNKLTEEEYNNAFKIIKNTICRWQEMKKDAMDRLPEMAQSILADFNGNSPILLYGYSSTIVKCLEYLIQKYEDMNNTLKIYVCQGATKNIFRYNNRLVYCDGIKYIQELKRVGIKNISYIPDSCASNLFLNGEVKKAIFGANGIDRSGYIVHTLGHLAIADMAKAYNIPVYVIADSLKIGDFSRNPKLQRKNMWLTTDISFESEIQDCDNYNPREDIVPLDRITQIITEKGGDRPARIGDYEEKGY